MGPVLIPEEFGKAAGVSRETLERFRLYADLLRRWQRAVNLVSAASLSDLWRRHFLDCAQLAGLIESKPAQIVDLGSGAGFPGLVLALLGVGSVVLVESDQRKCEFLREVIRQTGASARVEPIRIESLPDRRFDAVTARALAPFAKLLEYAAPLVKPGGVCLFLKGRISDQELTEARKGWNMRLETIPSAVDQDGVILRIREIASVRSGRSSNWLP